MNIQFQTKEKTHLINGPRQLSPMTDFGLDHDPFNANPHQSLHDFNGGDSRWENLYLCVEVTLVDLGIIWLKLGWTTEKYSDSDWKSGTMV